MSAGARAPVVELQIHSPDIRQGVRSRFVDGLDLVVGVVIVAALILWIGWGVAVTPTVARSLWTARVYEQGVEDREELGGRLVQSYEDLRALRKRVAEVGRRVEKIRLAYGLSTADDDEAELTLRSADLGSTADSIFASTMRDAARLARRIGDELGAIGVQLDSIQDYERAHREQARSIPSTSPIARSEFVLTSPYGTRRNPFTKAVDFHSGIDMAALEGTAIRAPGDGVVLFAGRVSLRQSVSWWRYGTLVVLRHGERFVTLYGHCRQVKVSRGEAVKRGEVIATVGNSGWSTNPHLHYEVRLRVEGGEYRPVDPRIYILDQRWSDDERLLVSARRAPAQRDFEPLPPVLGN